jgi:NTE family protein
LDARDKTKRVAIACQGGGSHTAFTAGALKKILEKGHERHDFVAFSGTSGGAVCALLAWYALLEYGEGEAGARETGRLLDKFWLKDNAARDVPERLLNDWLVGWLRWQKMTGLLVEGSPNAFSDYWQGRLRRVLEENVPFGKINGELVKPSSPKLFVGAVNVLTGEFGVFASHRRERAASSGAGSSISPASSWVFNEDPESGIGVDAILASAAIPPIFRAVRIGGSVYWDGLFSQNPPVRELLNAQPDEIWVIQINQSRMAPRPKEPEPGDEPTSVVEILDRRNALAGNLSLNQELRHLEEINELVEELGEGEDLKDKRLRLEKKGREYKPTVVRQIEMSWPLGATSKLDRSPSFIRRMMGYGERRAEEFFGALAFEEMWASRNPDAVLGFFAEDAEIHLGAPFRDRASYKGEQEIRDFVWEHLTNNDVRIDPTKKEVVGEAVTWMVRISPHLSNAERNAEPAEGTVEALFEGGKIRSLTFVPSKESPTMSTADGAPPRGDGFA